MDEARLREGERLRQELGLPKLERPPEPEPTPEELERRRKIGEAMRRLRDEIGPVDMTLEELFGDD